MKYLLPVIFLLTGCAAHRDHTVSSVKSSRRTISDEEMPEVRTSEVVKAYPVGRYTDPSFPEEMHERHTVYRREEAPSWNYRPGQPYALPLGPVVSKSNPSPSYYAKTNQEQIAAQQEAYASALLEQNHVLKERIDALQKDKETNQKLQNDNQKLRLELDSKKVVEPQPLPAPASQSDSLGEFSISDPGEIVLDPQTDEDNQPFLISQMQLNDELKAELASLERRHLHALLTPSLFALTKPTP